MIKPEEDLELSIKALEVYPIEPAIIKSMLLNLQKVVKQNCNLQNVNASNSEITWVLLENKDFENSFAIERLGINKNTIISIESDPEGDGNYKMVYDWR